MELSDKKVEFFETTGQSMWPSIRTQDKVIVVPVTPQELRLGDLILYRENDKLICHRLVRKLRGTSGYLFWVRGDATRWGYETVDRLNLVGRVSQIIRDGKVISQETLFARLFNWGAIIFAPLFMIFFSLFKKNN